MSDTQTSSKWEVPKSYDIGVHYYHRNLLKGNPYQERFFRQWIARIDDSNIKKYYDYETEASLRSTRGGHPLQIDYDQIERMVRSANLPRDIESQVFDHLDYFSDNKSKIDFRRVKEFFAFAGVEGVYDLEAGKHFQVEYDPAFTVDNLNINEWTDVDRLNMARMMADKGEIPDHRATIKGYEETIADLSMQALSESDIYAQMDVESQKLSTVENASLEELERSSRNARQSGVDFGKFDEALREHNEAFELREDVRGLRQKIQSLKDDEAAKIEAAMAKVPTSLEEFPVINPELTQAWDVGFEQSIADEDRWAKAYFDGKGPADFPNHEPDEDEAATLDKHCLDNQRYDLARYNKAFAEFVSGPLRDIRVRNAAFKDWILKDFVMSPVNKGELAKFRKLDVPRDFANAVRDELRDGLMSKIKAPVRIEKVADGSGRYTLIFNNLEVGDFHPDEVLNMATEAHEAPQDPKDPKDSKDSKDQHKRDDQTNIQDPDGVAPDAEAYIPGEDSPQARRTASAEAQARQSRPDDSRKGATPDPRAPGGMPGNPSFPGMGAMPGAGGMPGMRPGMGGMGGMGAQAPMFSMSLSLPSMPSFKNFAKTPGVFSRNAFDAGSTASSITAKSHAIQWAHHTLKSGTAADGSPLTADQTLSAWSDLNNNMHSMKDDLAKANKYGQAKGTPELADAITKANEGLKRAQPYINDKAKEPGAVGEAAKKAKENMEKLVQMIQQLVKLLSKLFSKDRSSSPEPS